MTSPHLLDAAVRLALRQLIVAPRIALALVAVWKNEPTYTAEVLLGRVRANYRMMAEKAAMAERACAEVRAKE